MWNRLLMGDHLHLITGVRGFVDDVTLPHETRKRICRSLVMLRDKKIENPWCKHGNIPL